MLLEDSKENIVKYDKEYVWHPFTQMKEWVEGEPLVIDRGEGNYIIDIDGNRYLDGVSSIWCNVFGHRRKEIDDAVRFQLDKISHSTYLGLAHPTAALLAKKLAEITPGGLNKTFYSDSGSEAVEIALKMAFLYWKHLGHEKRNRFIAFKESYHGDTIGSVSVGGIDTFHSTFNPLLFSTHFAESPYCRECQLGKNEAECSHDRLAGLRKELEENAEEYAAVIVEPLIQGAGGILAYPKGVLKEVRRLCDEHNVLLIADEVATGFGRTGELFACDHEDVVPDIICLAKGISGGYLPLAATLTTEKVYNAYLGDFSELKTFFHGHTYTANPLSCAAALATLELFEKEDILSKVRENGEYLKGRLYKELLAHEHVSDVRMRGTFGGVELIKDKGSDTAYHFSEKMGYKVCDGTIKRGVWLRPLGNVVIINPPLSISKAEIDDLVNALKASVEENT